MSDFSFAIVTLPYPGSDWTEQARDAESDGFAAILLPDTLFTPSPFPVLAAAAAVTTRIHLRPNVLAAPLRSPAMTAREVAALQLLSGGRFELGIGAGRPEAQGEAEKLGMPWGSGTRRREQVRETVEAVRAAEPATPVIVAASGQKMLSEAAAYADRITLAARPQATEAELADLVRTVRDADGRQIGFSHQLIGIGEHLQMYVGKSGIDVTGAAALLPGDPAEAADLLVERRERLGIDEYLVAADLAGALRPVIERLA